MRFGITEIASIGDNYIRGFVYSQEYVKNYTSRTRTRTNKMIYIFTKDTM